MLRKAFQARSAEYALKSAHTSTRAIVLLDRGGDMILENLGLS